MDQILISFVRMLETSGVLRQLNYPLTEALYQMKIHMNELEGSWESEASLTIRTRFNALEPRFEQYHDVIEAYARFLDLTVQHYEATEATLKHNADNFV